MTAQAAPQAADKAQATGTAQPATAALSARCRALSQALAATRRPDDRALLILWLNEARSAAQAAVA